MLEILKYRMQQAKLLEQWKEWSKRIAGVARRIMGECKVFVFGSAIEGKATGGSDVDILIICRNLLESRKERAELIAKIEEEAGLPLYHCHKIRLVSKKRQNGILNASINTFESRKTCLRNENKQCYWISSALRTK